MTDLQEACKRNFGQSAATYDEYALVQKDMARDLLAKIKSTRPAFDRILEIGCGTGFLTELLAREYPQARIIALDIAPEMLARAKKQLVEFTNIAYLLADGENLSPAILAAHPSYDLIVSNAVFQWFSDYRTPLAQYHSRLKPDGYLIFNTLGAGTFKELYACLEHRDGDPARDSFVTPEKLREILSAAGFQSVMVTEMIKEQYFDSSRRFLTSLKRVGAHKHQVAPGFGLDIFQVVKRYDAMFPGAVTATYHCLLGCGQRVL